MAGVLPVMGNALSGFGHCGGKNNGGLVFTRFLMSVKPLFFLIKAELPQALQIHDDIHGG